MLFSDDLLNMFRVEPLHRPGTHDTAPVKYPWMKSNITFESASAQSCPSYSTTIPEIRTNWGIFWDLTRVRHRPNIQHKMNLVWNWSKLFPLTLVTMFRTKDRGLSKTCSQYFAQQKYSTHRLYSCVVTWSFRSDKFSIEYVWTTDRLLLTWKEGR